MRFLSKNQTKKNDATEEDLDFRIEKHKNMM